jgi:hypothetical protein
MRTLLIIIGLFFCVPCWGQQGAQMAFNRGAQHFVNEQLEEARKVVSEGLRKYPDDTKLKKLWEELNNKQQQQEENQDQDQDQNQDKDQKDSQENKESDKGDKGDQDKEDSKDSENQEQEKDKKDQDKKDSKEKDGQEPKDPADKNSKDEKEGEQKQKDESPPQPLGNPDKMKEMKISEEQARMILEAMKNNELQYLQQQKRKPTQRKDPNKPDW